MKRNTKHDLKITVHPIFSLYTPSNNSLTLMLSCQTFFTMIHHKSFINSPIDRLEYPLFNFRHFCVIRSYAALILKEFSYLGEPFHSLNLKPLFCKLTLLILQRFLFINTTVQISNFLKASCLSPDMATQLTTGCCYCVTVFVADIIPTKLLYALFVWSVTSVCQQTVYALQPVFFLFVFPLVFPFLVHRMRHMGTHTNTMWAHLCVIKLCFFFLKVSTLMMLLSLALSRQTAMGTNSLLLCIDIQPGRETEKALRGSAEPFP